MTEAPSLSRDLAQTSCFFELRRKARFPAVRYLGIEVDDALEIYEQTEI